MKLFLYIDSMQRGGAQRVMNNIAESFVDNGDEVLLINDIVPDPSAPEYEIDGRIGRYFLDEGNDGRHKKNPYRIARLRKLVKEQRPEAILSFLGPPNIRMLAATLGLKVRKIVSVRNDPEKEYGKGIKKAAARFAFRFADGAVFQTEAASKYFPKAVRKRSKVIFNPVNEKFYTVQKERGDGSVAVVGRLHPQKNPLLAVRAFSLAADEYPNSRLVFFGDGELKNEITELAKKLGIAERVIVSGSVDDVENRLARASVYMLTSDYEGMPNALLEAMAVGVPAIAADCPCGGPAAVIENDTRGILVPCGSAEAFAGALRKLLSDPILCEKMSRAEKARAEDFRCGPVMKKWREYIMTGR